MFGFLGFILIFILLIIFIVLAFLGNILRMIFGLGKRAPKQYNQQQQTGHTDDFRSSTASSNGKKKIFSDDEGEYVEFEEVK